MNQSNEKDRVCGAGGASQAPSIPMPVSVSIPQVNEVYPSLDTELNLPFPCLQSIPNLPKVSLDQSMFATNEESMHELRASTVNRGVRPNASGQVVVDGAILATILSSVKQMQGVLSQHMASPGALSTENGGRGVQLCTGRQRIVSCCGTSATSEYTTGKVKVKNLPFYQDFLDTEHYYREMHIGNVVMCLIASYVFIRDDARRWIRRTVKPTILDLFPGANAVSPLSLLMFSGQPFVVGNCYTGKVARLASYLQRLFYIERISRTISIAKLSSSGSSSLLPRWLLACGDLEAISKSVNDDFDMIERLRKQKNGGEGRGAGLKRRIDGKIIDTISSIADEDDRWGLVERLALVTHTHADLNGRMNNHRTTARRILYERLWFLVDWLQDMRDVPEDLRSNFKFELQERPSVPPFEEGGELRVPTSVYAREAAATARTDATTSSIEKADVQNNILFEKTRENHGWLVVNVHYMRRVRTEEVVSPAERVALMQNGPIFVPEHIRLHLYDVADEMIMILTQASSRAGYLRSCNDALRAVHCISESIYVLLLYISGKKLKETEKKLMAYVTPYVPKAGEHKHTVMFGSAQSRQKGEEVAKPYVRTDESSRRTGECREHSTASAHTPPRNGRSRPLSYQSSSSRSDKLSDYWALRRKKREISYSEYRQRMATRGNEPSDSFEESPSEDEAPVRMKPPTASVNAMLTRIASANDEDLS